MYIYIISIHTYIYINKLCISYIYKYIIYIYILQAIYVSKKRRFPDLWGLLALEGHQFAFKTQRKRGKQRQRKRKRKRETIF